MMRERLIGEGQGADAKTPFTSPVVAATAVPPADEEDPAKQVRAHETPGKNMTTAEIAR